MDTARQEVALITKKTFSWLPTFFVDVHGQETVMIKKEFTFLKARYSINAAGIDGTGELVGCGFRGVPKQKMIGAVSKKWFTWGDSYQLQIADDEMERLHVAIDCAKAARTPATESGG